MDLTLTTEVTSSTENSVVLAADLPDLTEEAREDLWEDRDVLPENNKSIDYSKYRNSSLSDTDWSFKKN